MSEKIEKWDKVDISALMKVSKWGSALVLRIGANLRDALDTKPGDILSIKIVKIKRGEKIERE